MSVPKTIVADTHELSIAGLTQLAMLAFGEEPSDYVKDIGSLSRVLAMQLPAVLIIDPYCIRGLETNELEQLLHQHPLIRPMLVVSQVKQDDLSPLLRKSPIAIVTKNCSRREMLAAMEAILHGEKFICNKVMESFIPASSFSNKLPAEKKLSDRETEIIQLIAHGYSTDQIGEKLCLSPHTVHAHRKNILKKMEVATPVELVVKAIREKLIVL